MASLREQQGTTNGQMVKEQTATLLVYLRELGSMALLGLVLYGAYDLAKNQGRDLIEVLEALRGSIEKQTAIQAAVLKSIEAREERRSYERSNWTNRVGPPAPTERRTQ